MFDTNIYVHYNAKTTIVIIFWDAFGIIYGSISSSYLISSQPKNTQLNLQYKFFFLYCMLNQKRCRSVSPKVLKQEEEVSWEWKLEHIQTTNTHKQGEQNPTQNVWNFPVPMQYHGWNLSFVVDIQGSSSRDHMEPQLRITRSMTFFCS